MDKKKHIGKVLFKGQTVEVEYFFDTDDDICFRGPDGIVYITHYKSLIV